MEDEERDIMTDEQEEEFNRIVVQLGAKERLVEQVTEIIRQNTERKVSLRDGCTITPDEIAERIIPVVEMKTRKEMLQKLSGYFRDDGELRKTVNGALTDMINVHGEINLKNKSSASKRITHQIASYIKGLKNYSLKE